LRRFRDTAAAAGLEYAKETWHVVAWPWTRELPLRVMLECENGEVMAVTMGEGGIWLATEEPRELRVRSVEALARDARGLPNLAG
jgi:hypothetical protein